MGRGGNVFLNAYVCECTVCSDVSPHPSRFWVCLCTGTILFLQHASSKSENASHGPAESLVTCVLLFLFMYSPFVFLKVWIRDNVPGVNKMGYRSLELGANWCPWGSEEAMICWECHVMTSLVIHHRWVWVVVGRFHSYCKCSLKAAQSVLFAWRMLQLSVWERFSVKVDCGCAETIEWHDKFQAYQTSHPLFVTIVFTGLFAFFSHR